MNKLYTIGAVTSIIGLVLTAITWLLHVTGLYTVSNVVIVVWGLMAMVVFFESTLDLTIKYLSTKKENN